MSRLGFMMIFLMVSTIAQAEMTYIGKKPWCTVNKQWLITECLYDSREVCNKCAFVDGEAGLKIKEYCAPKDTFIDTVKDYEK